MAGLATALVYWWIWGAINPHPVLHDEAAYLLQARIFAGGHWTAPARPLPEFFDQFHVLVTPVLAAKYPPGHSLLLATGPVHFPAVVPLLLNAVTGALLFATTARLCGSLTGAIAWLLWLLAPMNLKYRPTFLSNVTTAATWMLAWWALLRWSESGARRWAVMLGACVAWCLITRPLTGAIFAASLTFPVMAVVRRTGAWKDLGAAALVAIPICALLPLANQRTTGRWMQMPWTTYSRQYMPYDRLGFGLDSTPPARPINQELARYNRGAMPYRRAHNPALLPRIAAYRTERLLFGMWGPALAVWLPVALLGVLKAPRQAWYAVPSVILLVLAHLAYAHPVYWDVYYMEALPVLAFFTAVGAEWLLAPAASAPIGRRVWQGLAVVTLAVWFVYWAGAVPALRSRSTRRQQPFVAFAEKLSKIGTDRAVVFVSYGPRHSLARSLVVNEPDLERARIWMVHDRGPENARLLGLAPDRAAYRYDEASHTLVRLPRRPTVATPPPPY